MRKVVLLGLLLAPAILAAQERIVLRGAPKPNQLIRFSMVQELQFDVTMAGGSGMGPMKVEGRMNFAGLQKVSAPDAQGQVTAELTLDTVTMNLSMNGTPTGSPADQLVGKTFTIIYDKDGSVVDVKTPEGISTLTGDPKQLISSITGVIPKGTLAVGESVTVPLSIPIPVPIPGTTGPTSIDSKITSKLTGITREGGDRIATLAQTTEGSMNSSNSGLDFHMTGSGTMQLNVDKGFVKAGDSTANIDMAMQLQGMAMKMIGTMHVVVTGSAKPAP